MITQYFKGCHGNKPIFSSFFARRQSVSLDKCFPHGERNIHAKWDICTIKCSVDPLSKTTIRLVQHSKQECSMPTMGQVGRSRRENWRFPVTNIGLWWKPILIVPKEMITFWKVLDIGLYGFVFVSNPWKPPADFRRDNIYKIISVFCIITNKLHVDNTE